MREGELVVGPFLPLLCSSQVVYFDFALRPPLPLSSPCLSAPVSFPIPCSLSPTLGAPTLRTPSHNRWCMHGRYVTTQVRN